MSTINFNYFNIRVRGEFIRWIFAHTRTVYNDNRIDFAEWPSHKPRFEFGQLPMLEIDGRELVTSIAIGRYVASKHALYPTDIDEIYKTESMADWIESLYASYGKIMFQEKNPAGWDEFTKGEGLQKLKLVETKLKENQSGSGFFIGSRVSMVDFIVAAYVHSHYFLDDQASRLAVLQRETPALKAYIDRFLAQCPEVANYIRTRPQSLG